MFIKKIAFLVPIMELYFEETFYNGKANDVYDNVQDAMDDYCYDYIMVVSKEFYHFCLHHRVEISNVQDLRDFCNEDSDEEVINTIFVYWVMYTYTSNELCKFLFL
jgi:hypothetical protein